MWMDDGVGVTMAANGYVADEWCMMARWLGGWVDGG